jgi:putative Mg2+ transporter-C (MgtC) family protein
MYVESVTGTAFGIIALTLVRRFEDKDDHLTRRRVMLGLSGDLTVASARMLEAVVSLGGKVFDTEYERDLRHEGQVVLTIDVTLPVRVNVPQLVAALEEQPGLTHIHVRSLH